MTELFYAHTGILADLGDGDPLREHLRKVAHLAMAFAEKAVPSFPLLAKSAELAGLLHDLGKYRPEFQRYIRKLPVQREKTYHKQAGAIKAFASQHAPLAFAILGHHGGMPD